MAVQLSSESRETGREQGEGGCSEEFGGFSIPRDDIFEEERFGAIS
jgi:hypothetical protein